jgi:hypothetical protein
MPRLRRSRRDNFLEEFRPHTTDKKKRGGKNLCATVLARREI